MNRQLFLFVTIVFAFLLSDIDVAKAQSANEFYTYISELKISEDKVDEVIDLLSNLQLESLESEEGCVIYDVMLSDEDATTVFIYESYENKDAYSNHIKSKHYTDLFVKKIKPMLKDLRTIKVFLLNFEEGYSDDVV